MREGGREGGREGEGGRKGERKEGGKKEGKEGRRERTFRAVCFKGSGTKQNRGMESFGTTQGGRSLMRLVPQAVTFGAAGK